MVSELISQRSWATEAGTQRFVQRHGHDKAADAYATMYQLRLSSVGMGTYLGPPTDETDADYVAALVDGVRRGINVIDTAGNYRCQRGERVVGQAIRELIASGEVWRSELFISSKAGFVPFDGQPPVDTQAWVHSRTVARGLATPDEVVAGCHCLSPAYLRAAIDQSLENLGLETLDVMFLHNPEAQLQYIDRETFDDRLRAAFMVLEEAVTAGKIRAYGLATWTGLRALPEERDHVSIERAVEIAREVAGLRHKMLALQLPVNLAMPEALTRANQLLRGRLLPALEVAEYFGLVTLASGALWQGKLGNQTPRHVPVLDGARGPVEHALQFARSAQAVTSALVGTRTVAHVSQNAGLLKQKKAPREWLDAIVARGREECPVAHS